MSGQAPLAKTAQITRAAPGEKIYLNLTFDPGQDRVVDVRVDGSRFERVEISHDQMCMIGADAVVMALLHSGSARR